MEDEHYFLLPPGPRYRVRLVTDENGSRSGNRPDLESSEPFVREEDQENDEDLETESHNDDADYFTSDRWANQRALTHFRLAGRPGVHQNLRTTRHSWDRRSAFKNPRTVPWEIQL